MLDLIKEIWQTMCTSKLRTILTGLSVAWGVFMLILLLSIANAVINSFKAEAASEDPDQIEIRGGRTSMSYQGLKDGRKIDLRNRDIDYARQAAPENIDGITAEYTFNATISTVNDALGSKEINGVFPSVERELKLKAGRFVNQADLDGARKVLVLPLKDAENLFGDAPSAIGRIVSVAGLTFSVVGVYEHGWRREIFAPYSTARAINGYRDRLDGINVHITGVSTAEQSEEIVDNLRLRLGKAEQFDPDDRNALFFFNYFSNNIQATKALGILNTAMWIIGLLTLITGIVGVSNIMFVSVRERTHEIGIRRAIGARPRSILTQVVLESVAMTTFFGYIGIVMGTLATEAVKAAFAGSDIKIDPSVDLSIAVEVTIALILAGALAGIFPALRAIKVKPVEALRDE